ncbi:MAG: cytosine permease [Treponema sp.]|jgi:putative hydroxymethylpyrimidine transporter CytX|nr:cytosine permease [Treponema sp.]
MPMLLLWLGAAISISEIFTGGMLAPLGLARGLAAILTGHLIGAGFLAYAGYISFLRKANAMASVAESFGAGGGRIIALCNVVQLLGWTIVMVVQAGSAITGIIPALPFSLGAFILALLVLIWALMFGSPAGQGIHSLIVALLAILCVVLFAEAAGPGGPAGAPAGGGTGSGLPENPMSFMLAVELSIAMPVSWLPLVGDYSCRGEDPLTAALMPFAGYFAGSVLMYALGLFISVQSGGDIFAFIAASPFRLTACAVVLLSTLTTAFLDLYSAVVSLGQLTGPGKAGKAGEGEGSGGRAKPWRSRERLSLLGAGLFTLIVSALFPAERYSAFLTAFLTVIGMVFVPVYALFFIDFLFRRGKRGEVPAFPLRLLLIAAAGIAGYGIFTRYELGIPSLLSMALVWALYLINRYAGKDRLI